MDQNQTFRPKIGGWRGWLVNDGDCICACVRTWWGRGFALNRSDHQIITFSSLSSDQPCDDQDFQWRSYTSHFWPPSCLIITLTPLCQWSKSFNSSLLLITNVSRLLHDITNLFAVYGSWTSTSLPWWYWWEQLIIWAAASYPITHLVPGAVQSECEGHSHQRRSTLVSPPSPSSYLFLFGTSS